MFEILMEAIKEIMPFYDKQTDVGHIGLRHGLHDKDASFAIIATRCDESWCTGKKILKKGLMYQLHQGYTIKEDGVTIERWRKDLNLLYDDYIKENTNGLPHVQFSAIVGKNGSGKSSIIELMMRLINNFATCVFDEVNHDPAAERLRYVENVCGTMWYVMNNTPYRLSVYRHHVVLIQYTLVKETEFGYEFGNGVTIFDFGSDDPALNDTIVHAQINGREQKEILSHLFYTLVSNYSIYAYNENDFMGENITPMKLAEIEGKVEINPDMTKACWIHSLFHKNDGYKVPLGITPYRCEGNIDINKEKDLSKERLISLMVRNSDYRLVNKHHVAEGLNINTVATNDFEYSDVVTNLGFRQLTDNGFNKLREYILKAWEAELGISFVDYKKKLFYERALDYIVYKTLKVSKQYREHHEFYKLHDMADDFSEDAVKELVHGECENHSHVTRKIFQAIAYLIYDIYDLTNREETSIYSFTPFEDIYKRWMEAIKTVVEDINRNKVHLNQCALMPPPFLENAIKMHPVGSNESVYFESLSSGERQQIYTISSILYHLDNLNSIKNDEFDKDRVFYPNLTVVLEEIELYFHPEMQQEFVSRLLDGVHAINLENINAVNFLLVTHSPYVLSDIPRTNILALDEKAEPKDPEGLVSFGSNIHDMLRTSFFLPDTSIGKYAQWEIKYIMACLEIHKWVRSGKEVDFTKYREGEREGDIYDFMERYTTHRTDTHAKTFEYSWFNEELGSRQLKMKIDLIDEPLLHNILQQQYNLVFGNATSAKEEKRKDLLKQLKDLDEDDIV